MSSASSTNSVFDLGVVVDMPIGEVRAREYGDCAVELTGHVDVVAIRADVDGAGGATSRDVEMRTIQAEGDMPGRGDPADAALAVEQRLHEAETTGRASRGGTRPRSVD